jgi:Lipid A 3-O-deacylase (PagL)
LFNVNQRFGLELMYDHMDTKSGLFNYGSQTPTSQQDVGINYILAGPVSSIYIPGSTVHPFFGAMLGAAVFTPGTSTYSNNTQFAYGAELGANIYVSPRFGLRLKAQLLSSVGGSYGGYNNYGGPGNGSDVYNYSAIYQFSLNAGIIIGLGKILSKPRPPVMYRRPPPGPYYRYSPYPPPPPPPPPYYH